MTGDSDNDEDMEFVVERDVVPKIIKDLVPGVTTTAVKQAPDGRLDLIDVCYNVYDNRSAARRALYAVLNTNFEHSTCEVLCGFGPNAVTRLRWKGQGARYASPVAMPNVALAILLSIRSRGGALLKASVATALTRIMAINAGMNETEIAAVEAPCTNAALTNATAAAVGAPVIEHPPAAPTMAGDVNINPNINPTANPTANPTNNITINNTPPRSPSSDDGERGGALVPSNTLTTVDPRIIAYCDKPDNHQARLYAERCMAMSISAKETLLAREQTKTAQEQAKTAQEQAKAEHEKTNAKRAEDDRLDALAKNEQELKRKREADELDTKRQRADLVRDNIQKTYHAAAEMRTLTPRLRHELSEQLAANLATGTESGNALVDADLDIPRTFTAKGYAEHLLGGKLVNSDEIKELRTRAAVVYQETFKVPATRVLGQQREGKAMVCAFKASDLNHARMQEVFAQYRAA